ncbi:MAG: helix-turn-helix transcriptional regulator [Thiotrichaceae bacterium]|nr:helix-turn-helix transcriptional regulator [Thiotrichaceae bacterium]
MFFNDPIEFENFITPTAGAVLIRPAIGASFNAEICMKRLEHVGLFTVSANSFKAVKDLQQDFYGLTIPLSAPFAILESSRNHIYESPSAHLLLPGQPFNFTAKRKCNFLVANFFADPVSDYSRKLLQSDSEGQASLNSEVSFFSQSGSVLLRSVAQIWTALNNNKPVSDIILKELEDDLLASFVLYAYENTNAGKPYKHDDPYHLSRAEDYISDNLQNPITRDQLAEVSSRSIRTLSRAFEKKYGIGPMAFIKQRRLDAAYLDLLGARPDTCSVTQVAFSYGFSHVGKLAIEYRKAFGETPSTSLVK